MTTIELVVVVGVFALLVGAGGIVIRSMYASTQAADAHDLLAHELTRLGAALRHDLRSCRAVQPIPGGVRIEIMQLGADRRPVSTSVTWCASGARVLRQVAANETAFTFASGAAAGEVLQFAVVASGAVAAVRLGFAAHGSVRPLLSETIGLGVAP